MQLTERHIIKPNNPLYAKLDDLTLKAKNLYNAGLYAYRQSYFEYRKSQDTQPLSWQAIGIQFRQDKVEAMTDLPSKVAILPICPAICISKREDMWCLSTIKPLLRKEGQRES